MPTVCTVADWLELLRVRPSSSNLFGESSVLLQAAGHPATRSDIELLPALLRELRTCSALVVVRIEPQATHLGLLDVVLILSADCAMSEAGDECPIAWPGTQRALESYVEALWLDMTGTGLLPSSDDVRRPLTIGDLRSGGLISTGAAVAACAVRTYSIPHFLLGLRRAGALRIHTMDKMSFNYYWVTKVFSLNEYWREWKTDADGLGEGRADSPLLKRHEGNGLAPAAGGQCGLRDSRGDMHLAKRCRASPGCEGDAAGEADLRPVPRPHRAEDSAAANLFCGQSSCGTGSRAIEAHLDGAGTLHLTLRAEIIEMDTLAIDAALSPWLEPAQGGARVCAIVVVLPPSDPALGSDPAGALGSNLTSLGSKGIIPREVRERRTTVFKWYRKWELLLKRMCLTAPIACAAYGMTAPCLLEIFFAASARAWCCGVSRVGFGRYCYLPGPTAMQGLSHLGRATLHTLLLEGIGPRAAVQLGIISILSPLSPPATSSRSQPASTCLHLASPDSAAASPPNGEDIAPANAALGTAWLRALKDEAAASKFPPTHEPKRVKQCGGAPRGVSDAETRQQPACDPMINASGMTAGLAASAEGAVEGVAEGVAEGAAGGDAGGAAGGGRVSCSQSELLLLLQSIPQGGANLERQMCSRPPVAYLVGLSLALPGQAHRLTQAAVCQQLGLQGTDLASIFAADHIETRYLAEVGAREPGGGVGARGCPQLSHHRGQGDLTEKHLRWARALLVPAIRSACADAGCSIGDVGCLVVCTSTGYLLPGLSAYLLSDLSLSRGCARLDIVGMGCHAGLNSLQAAANWAHAHAGSVAIACAVEVCSAHSMWAGAQSQLSPRCGPGQPEGAAREDGTEHGANVEGSRCRAEGINHAVVNSLFSDGAFAAALLSPAAGLNGGACSIPSSIPPHYAALHEFSSITATEAIHTMTYRWDERASQFWFSLSEDAPYAVGVALHELGEQQRQRGKIPLSRVRHWVLHTGGQTVIDAATASLGLDLPELEATVRALKRYGNNSSASFMFGYDEFLQHPPSPVSVGDVGAFITMGPGAGLELCVWTAGTRAASSSCVPLPGWEPAALLPMQSSLVQHVDDPPSSEAV